MPTYEYACRSCGEHLDVVQSFRDEPLTECPACGGDLRKVFGSIGIVFKGSGFYKTDSRHSGKTASVSSSSGESTTKWENPNLKSSNEPASKDKAKADTSAKPAASTSSSSTSASAAS